MSSLRSPVRDQALAHAERTTTEVRGVISDFNKDRLGGPSKRDSSLPRETREMILGMLLPEEPLPPPPWHGVDHYDRVWLRRAWMRRCEKQAKFPGYRPGNWIFDFIPLPSLSPEAATPTASMSAIVRDAQACWSGEVDKGHTKQQFLDWMPTYLTKDRYVRRWQNVGHLAEAARSIGQMYGIPSDAMRRTGK